MVFSDASGFTALTEALAKKPNGAELLSKCLDLFFTPLIDLINAYRGDVIKFSGDALMIYFQAYDDDHSKASKSDVPPHGTYGLPDLGPMSTSVLRASACCIEIHKRLHNFDTHVGDVRLCLHIGLGCGTVSILQVASVSAIVRACCLNAPFQRIICVGFHNLSCKPDVQFFGDDQRSIVSKCFPWFAMMSPRRRCMHFGQSSVGPQPIHSQVP